MKEKRPKVSVIIPVYNTEKYLERCLMSVLDNTYRDIEVICVNDGSTDNSLLVLNRIAERDCRVRVIDKENGGVSSARNRGLDEAKGEWICFVDSDDWIHKDFIHMLLSIRNTDDVDILVCGYKMSGDDNVEEKNLKIAAPPYSSMALDQAMEISFFRNSVCGRLYKACLIGNKRFPDALRMAEDQVFNVYVVSVNETIQVGVVECPLYFYYSRPGSATHSYNEFSYFNAAECLVEHLSTLCKNDYAVQQAFRLILIYRYESSFSKNSIAHKHNANKLIRKLLPILWISTQIPFVKKMRFTVLSLFSWLYRIILIVRDRTMLAYEKQLKQRQS